MRPLLLTLMCVATLMLAGCGNKGPLFMPEAKPTPPAAAAAPAHASTAATPAQH
ncbi:MULTISPECIES: LPS translocon maturation chaperone LptM [Dyella]|uniref:Sugar transporter n=2 Tax=Dyella TaxID=231454 RepID=A0A4R0YPS7_9GAMM|nr:MULTISPECIES: lipoprotein [Dyella]TBR35891.1 sugar transporter [Dyella terrae]TCI08561.1 sugar transporter [Dyella soli]